MAEDEQLADDDTAELIHASSHSGGLCGAITDPGACVLPAVDVKGRITDLGADLKLKGAGVISKLQRKGTSASEASLYDPSLYLCGGEDELGDEDGGTLPIPASEIGDPSRTVCVVTTAALPWRTGTAVNPLLRALYLVRLQNEKWEESQSCVTAESNLEADHKKGSVALVVPWLESRADRAKLYGSTPFADGPAGMRAQEAWIRDYAATRCGMPREARELRLIFYPAFYLAGFGSIFPKVDLCNFVPRELVDVAILEEPEHLNWFRMPNGDENSTRDIAVEADDGDEEEGEENIEAGPVEVTVTETASSELAEVVECDGRPTPSSDQTKHIAKAKLGWTHRFRFVVGIVHTNYEAYARQYGVGASLIAAPAIGAVSALTIRAHCHQVIKLSATLPSFAPGKEITCNVHGVRREFLEGVDLDALAAVGTNKSEAQRQNGGGAGDPPSPVYFIGKLVWAKGFDLMLELQDIFRKKNGTYFSIDIYGGGPEEKAIARAFHGRNHASPAQRPAAPASPEEASPAPSPGADAREATAAAIMANPASIKDQSQRAIQEMRRSLQAEEGSSIVDDVVARYLSLGFEVCQASGSATYVTESRKQPEAAGASSDSGESSKNPIDILGDLSGKSFDTGVKTSQAVYNIADSSIKNILTMSFSQLKRRKKDSEADKEEEREANDKPKFVFDPPVSRYEWRRHPVPARFPGVIDHAQLKNAPHKIFLNPSTSEVLCTTTAEALAMNKFAIIPRHPSNEFFLQFANCLAYDTLEECAEKMAWALDNAPASLSEEERRKFTWEAATERLVDSSVVTVTQARERAENGMDKTDARIAYWLSESGEKGHMIRNLFHKDGERSPPVVD
ncbi:hypothetical protein ACHAXT_002585 [Thalassiosira profunda]